MEGTTKDEEEEVEGEINAKKQKKVGEIIKHTKWQLVCFHVIHNCY